MSHKEAKRRTLRSVVWALAAGATAALGACAKSPVFASGMVLGTASGALGLWLMQRRLETIGSIPPDRLQRTIYEWMGVRVVIYAIAFGVAYFLDRAHTYGLVGAVAGMLLFRGVFIGATLLYHRRRGAS